MNNAIAPAASFAISPPFCHPIIENPTLIRALQRALMDAECVARVAQDFLEQVQQQADRYRVQAQLRQEEADIAAARVAEEIVQLRAQMEESAKAARHAQRLTSAARHASREQAAILAREAQEERQRAQRIREEAEGSISAAKEKAEKAQRTADEKNREAEAANALAQKMARIAEQEAREAMEAKEEAERCLGEGIRPVVIPSPTQVAAVMRRIQYREDCLHFAVVEEVDEDWEQAQFRQEEADRVVVQAAEEMAQMRVQMEEAASAIKRSRELAEAASKVAKEDAESLAQEAKEEREQAQKMRDEAEKAMQAAKEEAERAQRAANEQRRKAEETRKANEARLNAERRLKEGIQPVVTPSFEEVAATKRRIQYREDYFHIAIAGISGSGKSSLVNAFRGLRSRDADAAAIGVTMTTLKTTRYHDGNPDNPYVWYDVPGAGTFRCRDWQYFNDQGLYVFDCIIVLFDNRFTATDLAILTNARRFRIPTYIVRSKADRHIRNLMMEMGYDSDEDEDIERHNKLYETARRQFVENTRKIVRDSLDDANFPAQRVYIVSSSSLLSIVMGNKPKKTIDELELLNDLGNEAYAKRRVRRSIVG